MAQFRDCQPVEEVLVIMGGMCNSNIKHEILAYSFQQEKWFILAQIPVGMGSALQHALMDRVSS